MGTLIVEYVLSPLLASQIDDSLQSGYQKRLKIWPQYITSIPQCQVWSRTLDSFKMETKSFESLFLSHLKLLLI